MVSVLELDTKPTVEIDVVFRNILNERHKSSFGKKVIELGVGKTSLIPFLNAKFGEKVFRMELEDWNERNNKINEKLVQGELQNLPIASNSVDLVVSFNKFIHHFDLKRAVQEIERILVAGGEALMEIPSEFFNMGELAVETGLEVADSRKLSEDDLDQSFVLSLKKK